MHSLETTPEAGMATTQQLTLPNDKFRLEEINMPEELAASLAGRMVTVEVFPEEPLKARRIDLNNLPDGLPVLVDKDCVAWNDYWPVRVLYTDSDGRMWRFPRHWLSDGVSPVIGASRYEVTHESSWVESWCPPTWWDLWDINIQERPAAEGEQAAADIEVSVAPGEIPKAFWKGPSGKAWRIPHDWRRRRIKLPGCEGLLRNNFPLDIAEEIGGRIVTVNYHPGSLCCLHDGYRVRDGRGGKWPVSAADCVVVGFGDETERHA
jgi:hypothetical protein